MGIHDNGSAPAPSPSSNRPAGRGYEYIKDGTKIWEAVKTVRATMKK